MNMSNKDLTLEEIKACLNDTLAKILEMYLSRCKQKEIIEKLNVTRGQIDSLVKKFNLTRFRTRNNYTINEDTLNIDNPLVWYFIGWFVSDGNLHKTNSGSEIVQFTLKDKEPLYIIKDILGFTEEVKTYNKTVLLLNSDGVKVPQSREYYFLGITNKKLVSFLESILNVLYRKTYYIEFPNIATEDCLKMFIRGYWDGDGCFTKNSSNNISMATAHCSSLKFCTKFKEELQKYNIEVYILNSDCPQIKVHKKEHYNKFVTWLYSIYPDICLHRKKDKAFSLLYK